MDIKFADTFGDSIKTMIRHNTWSRNKTYELFRYDLPQFFKNVWRFRSALCNHYWWDYSGSLEFLLISLTHMSDNIEKHGSEVTESRLKKVGKMRRAVQLIKNYKEDLYLEMAEKELGEIFYYDIEFEPVPDKPGFTQMIDKDTPEEKEHNMKVYKRAREIEKQEWNELFQILKGQDYSKFNKKTDWNEQFDGTGLKGWWD